MLKHNVKNNIFTEIFVILKRIIMFLLKAKILLNAIRYRDKRDCYIINKQKNNKKFRLMVS